MTKEEKVMNDTIRCVKHSVKHDTGMIYIGYNEDDKQFMSYLGTSENLVNMAARVMVQICKDCECPIDEVIDSVRKYMKKWEEEENEIRD